MAGYVCKFCGRKSSSTFSGSCPRSPHKQHELIPQQTQYVCKYCGRKSSSPFSGHCPRSPHKSHELIG